MKTNYKLLYLSLSGLLMFSSCSNDELENMNTEEGSEVTIMATLGEFDTPSPQTRTEVDRWYPGDGTNAQGVAMKWSKGDQIGVFGASVGSKFPNKNMLFTNKGSEAALTSAFSGTLNHTTKIFKAYYPYYENATENAIKALIPNSFTYSDKTSIKECDFKAWITTDNHPIWGGGTNIAQDNLKLQFQSLGVLLRFVINDAEIRNWIGEDKLSIGDKLKSITFTSTNNKITGSFLYDLQGESLDLKPSTAKGAKQHKKLTVNVDGITTETMNDGLNTTYNVVYAIVAPIASDTLNLSFKYGKHKITLKEVQTKGLERGKVYNIGLNATSLSTATISSPSEPVKPSGKTNGNEFGKGGNAI